MTVLEAPENLSRFAQKLYREWKRLSLPEREKSIVVAVSGGADSTALLLALHELTQKRFSIKIIVAHLNHCLRGEASDADEQWVRGLARDLSLEVHTEKVEVAERAAGDNLEQAARKIRYEFLRHTAQKSGSPIVLTAHTQNDQAETFLLRLIRGTSLEGLRAIEPCKQLVNEEVLLARPLLWATRNETVDYCRQKQVEFRSDEMNKDEKFLRVCVRRTVIPLLETLNPKVVKNLARTSELVRQDSKYLGELSLKLYQEAVDMSGSTLRVEVLNAAPHVLSRRAIRHWLKVNRGELKRIDTVHLLAIERLLNEGRGGRVVELPGGGTVKRKKGLLLFGDLDSAEKA
jgi:tRNA(Ile)-lysidine synthase